MLDTIVLPLTLVLAFCSIVYELLLGQTLTAFLGNTVLRYSVTIGLYMLSMGIGAMVAQARILDRVVLSLQAVELALTVLGGGAVVALCALDAAGTPPLLLSLLAHGLIVVIGILTGLEIPLLIELRSRRDPHVASGILGVDYVGAFLGTLIFAFYFYPHVGLVATSFSVAALNAVVGVLMFVFRGRVDEACKTRHRVLLAVQGALLVGLIALLGMSSVVTEFSVSLYLDA